MGTEMTDNAEKLRRLMDRHLLSLPRQTSTNTYAQDVFSRLALSCETEGISFDGKAAIEYWWTLARLGVIAMPGVDLGATIPKIPSLVLTDRGRRLLELGEQSPHDPPKYLAAVRRRVESPDEIAMTYLDEAVGAWSCGLYRASAVMLGCACERLVLLLAGAIADADLPSWSGKIGKKLSGALIGASDLFGMVRECLMQLPEGRELPNKLRDALDRRLSPIFDHARGLRNESGHPTGAEVTSEEAEAGLLLFPGFYGLASDLCMSIRANGQAG
jgi:hypothetical protein